jgi:LmbE family N-acetylglucosaminyl deacetylase
MPENVLVVAPHPDDEVLGCGGIIRKYGTAGKKVVVLIMSRGKPGMFSEERIINVRQEALKAHEILKVFKTVFLDFPAPDLDIVPNANLSASILKVIQDHEIDTVFLPHHGDLHHDHKAVFSAGLVAARPVNGNRVTGIFSYETLSETEWAVPSGSETFIPTFFVDISNEIQVKLEALQCYRSQLREFPNPRSIKSAESLARFRGSTSGILFAEAFMTIRIVNEI